KIEKMGGSLAAIETGYMQREITESAYRFQRRVEQGELTVVGLNRFAVEEKRSIQILRVDDNVMNRQIAKLADLKKRRDSAAIAARLDALKQVAIDGANVMPAIVECVEVSATLEEICNVLRGVYGEQTQTFI
ncbi:MAG TPA: methylmalonyl-CoA mutase family protein, partial [Chloroflexota bacterium]|nr:methylmalonyl-CoA mutase family protein [Chloroflexota bacterium]